MTAGSVRFKRPEVEHSPFDEGWQCATFDNIIIILWGPKRNMRFIVLWPRLLKKKLYSSSVKQTLLYSHYFLVCRLFETEKMCHSELKQTWKLANEQFLSQQTKLVTEMDRTKKILTPQQLEQLSREMRQERMANPVITNTPIQTVPEHPYQVTPGDVRKSNTPSQYSTTSGDVLTNFDPLVTTESAGNKQTLNTSGNTGKTASKDTILKQSKKVTPKMNRKGQAEDKQVRTFLCLCLCVHNYFYA